MKAPSDETRADRRRAAATDLRRRDFLVGGGLIAAAGLSLAASSLNKPKQVKKGTLEPLVPVRIGDWHKVEAGGVVLPDPTSLQESTYDDVISRVYQRDGAPPIMLLIALGRSQSGNAQLHRPEACYPAAGFTLGDRHDLTLRLAGVPVAARLIAAEATNRLEQVLYWTRIGSEFPLSPMRQRLAVLRANLRGVVPDGVLVRLSTVGEEKPEIALKVLTGFLDQFFAAAPRAARTLLVGAD